MAMSSVLNRDWSRMVVRESLYLCEAHSPPSLLPYNWKSPPALDRTTVSGNRGRWASLSVSELLSTFEHKRAVLCIVHPGRDLVGS